MNICSLKISSQEDSEKNIKCQTTQHKHSECIMADIFQLYRFTRTQWVISVSVMTCHYSHTTSLLGKKSACRYTLPLFDYHHLPNQYSFCLMLHIFQLHIPAKSHAQNLMAVIRVTCLISLWCSFRPSWHKINICPGRPCCVSVGNKEDRNTCGWASNPWAAPDSFPTGTEEEGMTSHLSVISSKQLTWWEKWSTRMIFNNREKGHGCSIRPYSRYLFMILFSVT